MSPYFVLKFSAKFAAVLSTFANVRYNIYLSADFMEGEMIRRLSYRLLLLLLRSVIVHYELCHDTTK
jgi:uncharacterized membrane protein